VATVVENEAMPTENIHAMGIHTVRVYRIYEVSILDAALIDKLLANSARLSHHDFRELAWIDFQNGGKGRANSVLALPLKKLNEHYAAVSPTERNHMSVFEGHQLSETVLAVFDDIAAPKYQRLYE